MNLKSLLVNLGKLLLCSVIFAISFIVGGVVVTMLGLEQPPMPAGMDSQSAMQLMLLESPLLALLLALLARHLAGGFWSRVLILTSLTWVCNSLNNQIEAAAFAGMKTGFLFTILTFLFPAVFISLAVAWLFPSVHPKESFAASVRAFFRRYTTRELAWRLALGAISFMPIYYFFGLLVVPFTRSYYEQNLFGLEIPSLGTLIPILFLRSLLFFTSALPILVAWQDSRWNLVWRLGLALFYLVGFQSLMIANWLPWDLRFPHMLEILADELIYAGVLVWLLGTHKDMTE